MITIAPTKPDLAAGCAGEGFYSQLRKAARCEKVFDSLGLDYTLITLTY